MFQLQRTIKTNDQKTILKSQRLLVGYTCIRRKFFLCLRTLFCVSFFSDLDYLGKSIFANGDFQKLADNFWLMHRVFWESRGKRYGLSDGWSICIFPHPLIHLPFWQGGKKVSWKKREKCFIHSLCCLHNEVCCCTIWFVVAHFTTSLNQEQLDLSSFSHGEKKTQAHRRFFH